MNVLPIELLFQLSNTIYVWTFIRSNDWTNYQFNNWLNECTTNWILDLTGKWMYWQPNYRFNWMILYMYERINVKMNELMWYQFNYQLNGCISNWTDMNEWVNCIANQIRYSIELYLVRTNVSLNEWMDVLPIIQ